MSLNVSEADARRLLSAMNPGKPVQEWSAKRLELKLNDAGLVASADLDRLSDKNDRDLLRRVGRAIEEGEKIEVDAESEPQKEKAVSTATAEKPKEKAKPKGKAKPEASAKKKPSPKSTKGKTVPSKNGSGGKKDKFGAREGSNTAKFNSALSKTPRSMKELVEKAELGERTFYSHVRGLIEAGHVEETEKGFKLKG